MKIQMLQISSRIQLRNRDSELECLKNCSQKMSLFKMWCFLVFKLRISELQKTHSFSLLSQLLKLSFDVANSKRVFK